MVFGLPAIGETSWGQKVLDSINAVKDTADAALPAVQKGAASGVAPLDSNSRLPLANAPLAPRCHVYATAAQTLANDTNTVINWDAETYDAEGMHDNVTNNSRITLNKSGIWEVHGMVTIAATALGGRRFAFLNKNGVEFARVQQTPLADNNTYISIVGIIGNAVAGDYVTLAAMQDSGGALATVANNGGSPSVPFGYLSVTYLGA